MFESEFPLPKKFVESLGAWIQEQWNLQFEQNPWPHFAAFKESRLIKVAIAMQNR